MTTDALAPFGKSYLLEVDGGAVEFRLDFAADGGSMTYQGLKGTTNTETVAIIATPVAAGVFHVVW